MVKMFLLGTAREGSTRLKDKMLRPFAGTTLFNIYLGKMKALWSSGLFAGWGVAIPRGDARLLGVVEREQVPVILERPRIDPSPQPRNQELYYLAERAESHVMWINACLPLLPASTLEKMARKFLSDGDYNCMEPVILRKNWFYHLNGKPANKHATSTQMTEGMYESSQAAHIFEREYLLRTGQYFKEAPSLWVVEPEDCADIDYEYEFRFAEAEYIRRQG